MAEVAVVDIPGSPGEAFQCPYCSRMHPSMDLELDKAIKCPQECERCGCPMDIAQVTEFANQKAAEAAALTGPTARRTVTV